MDNNDSKPQQTGGLKLMTVFIAVLALHVLVIGGFTVYHLMSSGGDADLALDKNHKLKADGTVVTETTTPDAASPDKTADATGSAETPATPGAPAAAPAAAASTPAPDASPATAETATPAAAPAANPTPSPASTQVAANTPAATAPATPGTKPASSAIVLSGDDMGQASTIPAGLLPPPDEPAAPSAPAAHPATEPAVATVHEATTPIALTPKDGVGPMTAPAPLASTAPIGPVHMPANPPAATTNVASHAEHASAPAHEKDAVASTHEAKKETYTVKMTDTYKKIAESHHITVAELKAANHIKADAPMKTGQKLIIPSGKTSVAKSGATHDTSASDTASTASLSASPAGAAKSHRHYYTVTKGDTLKYIAKKFNVTPSALEEANNMNGTKLAVGEKLRIPSHEAHATASTSTSSASLTERTLAPVAAPAPAPIQPSQVETQPAPVEQPSPTPVATPALVPQPTPASNPELTSLNF
jgi:LysM repeat protein